MLANRMQMAAAASAGLIVQTTNTSFTATHGTSHTVDLPANLASGNLLIVLIAGGINSGFDTPAGWTELFDAGNGTFNTSGSDQARVVCFYKSASGSEGASVSVTSTDSQSAGHCSYRISGHTGSPEASTIANGIDDSPDPPSLTPSWGAKNTLWLSVIATSRQNSVSALASGYDNLISGAGDSGAGAQQQGRISVARRILNASSENPGVFTLSAAPEKWLAVTVAVQPA